MDKHLIFLTILLVALPSIPVFHAEFPVPLLSADYYEKSCPLVVPIVSSEMLSATLKEARMAASILRMHFHDCFVQGCDASVLLDDTPTFIGEKTANANVNSLRGFEVIDAIKERLETECPGVVSCADILTLAARDGVVLAGGPYWDVPLGRKDSTTASLSEANINIPMPTSNIQTLISKFLLQGLSVTDMVALVGGHTIGQARCTNFRQRLYDGQTAGNELYASGLRATCPPSGGDDNISPLDHASPTLFDNSYYTNLVNGEGLLTSDQEMYSAGLGSLGGALTAHIVKHYATDTLEFAKQFSDSMVKMGNIVNPETFLTGEIRKNCRAVNL
jgi:peroxidase